MANLACERFFLEKVAVYFSSTCCPTTLYMVKMKKMIRVSWLVSWFGLLSK